MYVSTIEWYWIEKRFNLTIAMDSTGHWYSSVGLSEILSFMLESDESFVDVS